MGDLYGGNEGRVRPGARLGLTLALGALGVYLLPGGKDFFGVNVFAELRNPGCFAWLTAACAGTALLHRIEGWHMPRALHLYMGAILALALLAPLPVEWIQDAGERGTIHFWVFGVLLLLLLGGASQVKQARVRGRWSDLSRTLATALTAPLLLYASRAAEDAEGVAPPKQVVRGILAVFPHLLAAGFLFGLLTLSFNDRYVPLGIGCMSFSVWSALGCALLFGLSPWPGAPCIEPVPYSSRTSKRLTYALLIAAAAALATALLSRQLLYLLIFFQPQVFWGGIGVLLLIVLVPWPPHPALPRLGALPPARAAHPLSTFLFLALAAAPLCVFSFGILKYIVSCELFTASFDPDHAGNSLDQTTCAKWFFIFEFFAAMTLAYAAAARWMSARATRLGYWAYTLPVILMCASLLCMLTPPSFWLLQIIAHMGWTVTRALGVPFAASGYLLVLAFLCWAIWPQPKENAA